MKNTTNSLASTFNEIIKRPQVRIFKVKAAPPKIQEAFNVLNKWQGNKHYLLAVKIEQDKLLNGLK